MFASVGLLDVLKLKSNRFSVAYLNLDSNSVTLVVLVGVLKLE